MTKTNYLGYTITATTRKGKRFYIVTVSNVPKRTLTEAKQDIIKHLITGKVKLLDRKKIYSKASQIKTISDLNKEISKINTMAKSKTGLKADGTLKKGYRYAKGGRIVKAKSK